MANELCWVYKCGKLGIESHVRNGRTIHECPKHAAASRVYYAHATERTTGIYTGKKGSFWRIVDPAKPSDYHGWSSTQEAADWYLLKNLELPSAARVESASQLTAYESSFMDLAEPLEPMPASEKWAIIDYCAANKIPTLHEAD